jgi:hypothetical protein
MCRTDSSFPRGRESRLRSGIVRVWDTGLSGESDPLVLEWAARAKRILLTHDIRIMRRRAYARLEAGLPMPGVFVVPQSFPIGQAIEDLLLIAECSLDSEWEGQVRVLPL